MMMDVSRPGFDRLRSRPALLLGVLWVICSASYLGLSKLSLGLTEPETGVAVFWPASGLALAIFCLVPARWWPVLATGVFTGDLAAELLSRDSAALSVLLALIYAVEPMITAYIFLRIAHTAGAMRGDLRRVIALFVTASVGVVPAALLGAWQLNSYVEAPYLETLRAWVLSDGIGILVVAPLALTIWDSAPGRRGFVIPAAVTAQAAITATAFGLGGPAINGTLPFLLLPLLLVLAAIGSSRSTNFAIVLTGAIAAYLTAHDRGPYAGHDPVEGILGLQGMLASLVLCTFVVAVVIEMMRNAERASLEHADRFASVLRAATDFAVIGTDRAGNVTLFNGGAVKMLGFEAADVLGQSMLRFHDRQEIERRAGELGVEPGFEALTTPVVHDGTDTSIWTYLTSDDDRRTVSVTISEMCDLGGRPTGYVCIAHDVTERDAFEAQLRRLADHDPLTGLFNRRRFEEDLSRVIAETARYKSSAALLMFDIDHFKRVNDTLGHNAGDELIKRIARITTEQLRESDIAARLGGDEFVVLMPHTDEEVARLAGQRLVDTVRAQTTRLGRESGDAVTISVGVAPIEAAHDLNIEAVLEVADRAMYSAKSAGRDTCRSITELDRANIVRTVREAWLPRIEAAVDNGDFVLFAQPILDVRTDKIAGHELLVRMRGHEGRPIEPGSFLLTAERHGLVHRIDEWVVSRACGLLEALHEQRVDARLGLNLSGRSIENEDLIRSIEERIRTASFDPRRLQVELTETAAISDIAVARDVATRFRELGCGFSLDDFGSGFGSLHYLKHLPWDRVKLDGEFIRNSLTDETDQLVIEALTKLAHGLGRHTVAEFVEDAETLARLREVGVDFAQGFHIGRPVPVEVAFPSLGERFFVRAGLA